MDKEKRGFSNKRQHPAQGKEEHPAVLFHKNVLGACCVPHSVNETCLGKLETHNLSMLEDKGER